MRTLLQTNKANMNTPIPLTPSDLGLTQFQFDNLHKLLAYAKAHPDIPFDMNSYVKPPDLFPETYLSRIKPSYPCGTTCCLAGMGVFAAIRPNGPELWPTYISRVFTNGEEDIYNYLFSDDHQNSLPHAIARLEDLLTNGLPTDVELTTHEVL